MLPNQLCRITSLSVRSFHLLPMYLASTFFFVPIAFTTVAMKDFLNWKPHSNRRKYFRLNVLHNIIHGKTEINKSQFLLPPQFIFGRGYNLNKTRECSCKTNVFKFSFFPQTIKNCYFLPSDMALLTSNSLFYKKLL